MILRIFKKDLSRSKTPWKNLKYDLFYVKNTPLAMDLIITFKTAKIVLLKSGAR